MKKYQGSYLSYFLMYMFYYLSMALFSGLISVYLMDKGYSASQVSFVVSCSFVVSMITQPIIGYINDKYDEKKCNASLLAISIIFAILFVFLKNIIYIAIVYSVVLALLNGTNPVIERMATLSKHKYGLIRIWGTIGYATGSQLSGLIYQYVSPEGMYLFFGIGMTLCVIGILGTQNVKEVEMKTKEKISLKHTILQKELIIYLIIAGLFYGVTNLHTTYLPAMLQNHGMATSQVTTILFITTLMELPVILLSGLYMNKLSNKQLLIVVFSLLLIQFATLSFVKTFSIQIVVIILTKSVTTMTFIMINMKVIASIINAKHQMSTLAIVATMKSLISILFQNIGGLIIDYTSYQIFYTVLLGITIAGMLIVLLCNISTKKEISLFH